MSKYIITTVLICMAFACKAQQIVPLTQGPRDGDPPNAYYKDTTNELNKYEGTWVTQYADTVVTINLVKLENVQFNAYTYDKIIGEIKLEVAGVVLYDSLQELNNVSNGFGHSFASIHILSNLEKPICSDCDPGEYRLSISYHDEYTPTVSSQAYFRHRVDSNGQEMILAQIITDGYLMPIDIEPHELDDHNILREGEYVFYKQ